MICRSLSPLCESCTGGKCDQCMRGYYLTSDVRVCSSCNDYDHRCSTCSIEFGCTECVDSLLRSIRRSGKRTIDADEPLEELTRELSINLPFGTQNPTYFTESEPYFIVTTPDKPLNAATKTCSQGLHNDSNFTCIPKLSSSTVCGHAGFFKIRYNNYTVNEHDKFLRIFVERSGGGYSSVSISYYIEHITTNDADLSASAYYTSSQTLDFTDGIIEKSFLITIHDDIIYERDEQFRIVLSPPSSGSLNSQHIATVTIVDNDLDHINPYSTYWDPKLVTTSIKNTFPYYASLQMLDATTSDVDTSHGSSQSSQGIGIVTRAGHPFSFAIGAVTYSGFGNSTALYTDRFYSIVKNSHNFRQKCNNTLNAYNNSYYTSTCLVTTQGVYTIHNYFAYRGSLIVQYFSDTYFEKLHLVRNDRVVNFTWGGGSYSSTAVTVSTSHTHSAATAATLINTIYSSHNARMFPTGGSDYVSVRWQGAILAPSTDTYYFKIVTNDQVRMWLDGELILDYFVVPYSGRSNFNTGKGGGSSRRSIAGTLSNKNRGLKRFAMHAHQLCELVIEYRTFQQSRTNRQIDPDSSAAFESHVSLWWGLSANNLSVVSEEYFYSLYELGREQKGSLEGGAPQASGGSDTNSSSSSSSSYQRERIALGSPIALIVVSDVAYANTTEFVFSDTTSSSVASKMQLSGSSANIVSGSMVANKNSFDDITLDTNPYISFIARTLQPYKFTACSRDRFSNLRNDDDPLFVSTELLRGSAELVSTLDVNDIVDYNIESTDSGSGEGSGVDYDGVGATTLDAAVTYNSTTRCFDLSVTPERAGTYLFSVYFEDRDSGMHSHVKDSPFEIYVLPSITYGPTSRVYALPSQSTSLSLRMVSGDCYRFQVEARDRFQNKVLRGRDQVTVYMYEIGTLPVPAPFLSTGNNVFRSPTISPAASVTDTAAPTNFYGFLNGGFDVINDQYNPNSQSLTKLSLPNITYGAIDDHGNGNYTATICPSVAGVYEIHVLLNSQGVSNQYSQFSMFAGTSFDRPSNRGVADMGGQSIDKSPYSLVVTHSAVYGLTSTAYGPGLTNGTVGVGNYFFVTFRDLAGNVVSDKVYPYNVAMSLDLSVQRGRNTSIQYFDLHNGTWLIEYAPDIAGINMLLVTVNNQQILGSPFNVTVLQGSPSATFSNIINGAPNAPRTVVAGIPYYFEVERQDIEGNLQFLLNGTKPALTRFEFTVNTPDGKNYSGGMHICPQYSDVILVGDGTVCRSDGLFNLYYGVFVPTVTGVTIFHIFLVTEENGVLNFAEISFSPFSLLVTEGSAYATNTAISGTLYETVAGVVSYTYLHLYDVYRNYITKSGEAVLNSKTEGAAAAVTGDPRRRLFHLKVVPIHLDNVLFSSNSFALPITNSDGSSISSVTPKQAYASNSQISWSEKMSLFEYYYYQGLFFDSPDSLSSDARVIGEAAAVTDSGDGSYLAAYSVPDTGVYSLVAMLNQPGLKQTLYRDLICGGLLPLESQSMVTYPEQAPRQAASQKVFQQQFSAVSAADSILKPTDNIAANEDLYVSLPLPMMLPQDQTSIFDQSVFTSALSFNLSKTFAALLLAASKFNETSNATKKHAPYFEDHLSARWYGLVNPFYPEKYRFHVELDEFSSFNLYLGDGINRKLVVNCTMIPVSTAKAGSRVNTFHVFENRRCDGTYEFSTDDLRNSTVIIIEFIHNNDPAKALFGSSNLQTLPLPFFALYWESVSTPYSVIPPSVLSHWETADRYNLTIVPAPLCSHCSNVTLPTRVVAGENIRILIDSRDSFGNLLSRGGDTPTVVAVGPSGSVNAVTVGLLQSSEGSASIKNGLSTYGNISDFDNSTYVIDFTLLKAGVYRVYVTVGCCPVSEDIGYPGIVDSMRHLLTRSSPYLLTIVPTAIEPANTFVALQSYTGGYAGRMLSFYIHLRDRFHNYINSSDYITTATSAGKVTTSSTGSTGLSVSSVGAAVASRELSQQLFQIAFTNVESNRTVSPDYLRMSVPVPLSVTGDGGPSGLLPESSSVILVHYNMTRSGSYAMSIHLQHEQGQERVSASSTAALKNSPYSALLDPEQPDATHTILHAYINETDNKIFANIPFAFRVYVKDRFNNVYSAHRSGLYVRLLGDYCDSLSVQAVVAINSTDNACNFNNRIIPLCTASSSGEYFTCEATARDKGAHRLVIMLLNTSYPLSAGATYRAITAAASASQPVDLESIIPFIGDSQILSVVGDGLTSAYYTSYSFAPSQSIVFSTVESGVHMSPVPTAACATATTIGAITAGSSYNDIIDISTVAVDHLRASADLSGIRCFARSVIYDGYVISPDTGPFYFRIAPEDGDGIALARVKQYNAVIYVDNLVVYDADTASAASSAKVLRSMTFVKSASYHIRVMLTAHQPLTLADIAYSLQWSYTHSEMRHIHDYDLRTLRWLDVPATGLHSAATQIESSPQDFNVN